MRNILVWTRNFELKNVGGPQGYLYNIEQFLEQNPYPGIDFYHKVCKRQPNKPNICQVIQSYFTKFIRRVGILNFLRVLYKNYYSKDTLSTQEIELINTYDFIHVHVVTEVLQNFRDKRIKSKIILTTHCPEPFIDEISALYGYSNIWKYFPTLHKMFIKKELTAYEIVDYVMFPVPQARQPYIDSSALYKVKFEQVENKFFYVHTALNSTRKIEGKENFEKIASEQDCLNICYIGRHNTIKGYDLLLRIAPKIWSINPKVNFIIGGKQGPLYGLNDKRWVELGWVNTPKLLNSVDVFILPNKSTYYDLILLEVLRQRKIVILSNTGGNIWFKEQNFPGMFFFDFSNEEDCINNILNIYNLKQDGQFPIIERKIDECFDYEFCMEKFIDSYITSINSLIV